MDIEFTELCTFFKYLDIECTDLILSLICDEKCSHIKKLCALNIQNCVCSLKICVHWIYRIVYIKYTKLCTFLKKLCTCMLNI